MIPYFAAAFGFLAHTLFWGVGAAILATPRPWVRFWPVFAAPAGLLLQSLVVWLAAHANLTGTNSYALPALVVPVVLAVLGAMRRAPAALVADVRAFGALWALMVVCLAALVTPMALGTEFLTTISLGSCDAADYAGGARTFMEFARSDRTGFMGLAEVVSVMSVDNFFDIWIRLNHFTPAAVLALNASVLRLEPHEITGISGAVFLALSLPSVWWLSRAGLRHAPRAAFVVTAIYALGPLTWYAVYHAALGQLLAAPAIAVLTWVGVVLWNRGARWREGWRMAVLLGISYGLILGSYNFIIVVCLLPAGVHAAGLALQQGKWAALGRWTVLMGAPLLATGAVFASRVAGLAERFLLFGKYDFGWRIPELTPEGWLGMLARPGLDAFPIGLRIALAALVVAAFFAGLVRAVRDRRAAHPFLILCLVVPVAVGYAYLAVRGRVLSTNASYDAYKLLSVFYPGLLGALCCWFAFLRSPEAWLRRVAYGAVAVALGFVLNSAWQFGARMSNPPLRVGNGILAIAAIESRSDVASVNVLLPDMWSRLWANALLLRKPQYFSTHTYEGRQPTALRGEWDLVSSLIRVKPAPPGGIVTETFSLVHTVTPGFRVTAGTGWYGLEEDAATGRRWRWSEQSGAILQVENPSRRAARTRWVFRSVGSLADQNFILSVQGREIFRGAVGQAQRDLEVDIVLPPGSSEVVLSGDGPPKSPGPGDLRILGFQVFGIDVDVQHDR